MWPYFHVFDFKWRLTLAVHGHRSIRALTDVQEAAGDDVSGCASVHEEQVVMVETGIREALGIVDLLVEAHYSGDVVLAEIWEISLRGM